MKTVKVLRNSISAAGRARSSINLKSSMTLDASHLIPMQPAWCINWVKVVFGFLGASQTMEMFLSSNASKSREQKAVAIKVDYSWLCEITQHALKHPRDIVNHDWTVDESHAAVLDFREMRPWFWRNWLGFVTWFAGNYVDWLRKFGGRDL
jgi:hypothetical protein